MTDKELLELAAKAAGYEGVITEYQNGYCEMGLTNHFKLDGSNVWSPLNNDGDALRLAGTLKIDVLHRHGSVGVRSDDRKFDGYFWESFDEETASQDAIQASTRRAIVRAAAAIGEKMP